MYNVPYGRSWNMLKVLTVLIFLYPAYPEILKADYQSLQNVTILNEVNFESETKTGRWFIIFYRPTCGGCKTYYQYFKAVVENVRGWPKSDNECLLTMGSVNCESDDGRPVCSKFNITGVPTLRFISSKPTLRSQYPTGINMEPHKNASLVLRNLVNMVLEETKIVPESSSTISDSVTVESNSSLENTLIIIEFQKQLGNRMKSLVNPSATKLTLWAPNGAVIMSGTPQFVRDHLMHRTRTTVTPGSTTPTVDRETFYTTEKPVYAIDVFRGLSSMFDSDMLMFPHIADEERLAVLELLSLLEKILPSSDVYREKLRNIRQWVSDRKEFSGTEWVNQLNEINFPLTQEDYIGCRGSSIALRGYPCSLWTIFHVLTVSQCEQQENYPDLSPKAVLHAMNRFLPRFFSCLECAYHFALNSRAVVDKNETAIPKNRAWPNTSEFVDYKALESLPPVPKTCEEQILWLNEAHNGVNKRLAGQLTEDPKAPKVQYPPRTFCPDCWAKMNGEWKLGATEESKLALLNYLKNRYSSKNWDLGGINPIFISSNDVRRDEPVVSNLIVIALVATVLTVLGIVALIFITRAIWRCKKKQPSYVSGRIV